ncbi:MAG: uncharacterized protein A8A55_3128 [Amphiamblys sp. WSBS2006]|nr:MAG: uncharacterized protein A8A55_3128 [Amphiamblys sp. WSBS2006]
MSLYLFSRVMLRIKKYDYFSIGQELYGSAGKWICFAGLSLNLACVCIIFCGSMTKYFKSSFVFLTGERIDVDNITGKVIFATVIGLITTGLSCVKNVQIIAKLAIIGFGGIFYVLAVLMGNNFYKPEISAENTVTPNIGKALFSFASAIVFAFANHFTYIESIRDMENPTPKRQLHVLTAAGAVETLVYGLFAYAGSAVFKNSFLDPENKEGDVLVVAANFYNIALGDEKIQPGQNVFKILYNIGTIMFFFACFFTFPLLIGPLRETIVLAIPKKHPKEEPSKLFFYSMTAALCVSFTILPEFIGLENLKVVIGYASSLIGAPLFFLLPAAFFWKSELSLKAKTPLDMALFLVVLITGIAVLLGFFLDLFKII